MKKRKSNRLKGYDYSRNNLYFITNCVKNNLCCLGRVVLVGTGRDLSADNPNLEYRSQLNQYGLIVDEKINWLISQYEYVDVHNYVIMPNHFHIILEIDASLVKNKISTNEVVTVTNELSIPQEEVKIKFAFHFIALLRSNSKRYIPSLLRVGFSKIIVG